MIREEKAVKAVLIILVDKRKCLMFDMKHVQKSKFKEFEEFLFLINILKRCSLQTVNLR